MFKRLKIPEYTKIKKTQPYYTVIMVLAYCSLHKMMFDYVHH